MLNKIVNLTLAVGSLVFIARKAEKAAEPPPINKYGTSFGIASKFSGFGTIFCRPWYLIWLP